MRRGRKKQLPAYRLHRPSGQAVVTLNDHDHYLGKHGTKASRQTYDRLVAEWLASARQLPSDRADLTVTELVARWWRYARGYYVKNGRPTVELAKIKAAMRPLKRLYGRTSACDFGPLKLKGVRQAFIDHGLSRRHINDQVARIKRMFKWAVENELVPPQVYHGLRAVSGLKRGRCAARETEPIRPVPDAHVDAVKRYVSRQVWAMIALQRLTGMRSGEVVIMRGCDLDISGRLWLYRPESHKTEHYGYDRVVELGPKAQAVIRPFLRAGVDAYLFSARDADVERRERLHHERKTPLSCGNRPGTNRRRKPKKSPGERYTPNSYRRAITEACEKAGVPKWHPHQLRHNYATRVRREYGIETARILLGHRSVAVTEVYAEVDRSKVRAIVAKIG